MYKQPCSRDSDRTFNPVKLPVSPAMALKLSVVLGRSPESWLLMQDNFDLWKARKEIDLNNYDSIEFAV
ncbi:MAG: hypothetical protein ABIJ59_07325 [Pseudomonadota bacterium]